MGRKKRERERTLEAPSVGGLADETTDAAETIIHVLRPQLKHLGPEDETTGLAGVCARVGVQVSREAGTAASQHKIPAEIFFFPCATTRKKTFEFGQKKKKNFLPETKDAAAVADGDGCFPKSPQQLHEADQLGRQVGAPTRRDTPSSSRPL